MAILGEKTMIRLVLPFWVFGASMVQAQFCETSVSVLPLDPEILGPGAHVVIHDQGYAQLIDLTVTGLSQVEVFLGVDGQNTEQSVRSGETTTAQIAAQCREQSPDCRSQVFVDPMYVQITQHYSYLNLEQTKIRVFSGGESLSVRATSNIGPSGEASEMANDVFQVIFPALMNCQ